MMRRTIRAITLNIVNVVHNIKVFCAVFQYDAEQS